MSTRVTSSRIIGRTAELAELEAALADATDGRPSLAFIAGESGVGKTRLLSELERRARADGARVIGGDCVELGEGELPYAPLVAALRPLAREGDPVLAQLPAQARAELATLLPELGAAAPAEVRLEEEGGAAQGRLFEALLSLLDHLGQDAPVLLSLEDIHWADRSTRSFLAYLARSLCAERVLALATYRSDELHRRHPLRPLLAELERAPRARRVELERLSETELSGQLEDILGAPAEPDLVARLYRRSEGNPLFTEELLAAGLDGRGTLPPTLRDALMVRVERLPEHAQEILRVLSALPRGDHELLAEASGMDARLLRDALRDAVAHHLVVVDGEGYYGFRHALLREVVADDMLPGERGEIHLALARALERRADERGGGAWTTAGVAYHYRVAGDQPAALRASVRAAGEAERVRAHGEAAALLERVLELWDRVPDAEALAGADHVEVLRRTADDHRLHGEDERRLALLEQAIAELDEERDSQRVAHLLGTLASAQWSLGRGDDSRATMRRALELLPEDDSGRERARLLAKQTKFLALQSRWREAVAAAEEALPLARAQDERTLTTVLDGMGLALIALGEHDRGVAKLREAIELGRRTGSDDDVATGYVNLGDALNLVGRSQEAVEVVEEGLAYATPQRAARWLRLLRAEIAIDLGEWDLAASLMAPVEMRYTGLTRANADLRRAELALGRGEAELARSLLDEVDDLIAKALDPQFIGVAGALRAELERRAGDLDAAAAAVDRALDRMQFCSEDTQRMARVATVGISVHADAAQRARDLGEDAEERAALLRADMLLEHVRALAEEDESPVTAAYLATAEAHDARAQARPSPELWATAAGAWQAIGRRHEAAVARWREAEAHVLAGDRDAAAAAAQAPLAVARELDARWLAGEVEGLAARARLRLEEEPADAETGAVAEDGAADPFGLTPRERQVLALVARGATNREIGAELFMAEKTASVHVSRILSKLGVRTRTEAAALAHRQGLEAG
jgi:DNA-binding CsgD family transcriptional regulator/tetratricopeptide (TPR) repeat protein